MDTAARVGITLGVMAALALIWWLFVTAPAGSRRLRLDRQVGRWGQRQVARGWRRPSFVIWSVTAVVIVIAFIWDSLR